MQKKLGQGDKPISLSVIIPAYNAATWLPRTLPKVSTAIYRASIKKAEFIVVDDGSSDDTALIAKSLKLTYPVKVISQENMGRFQARYTGAKSAKYPYTLFIDTRVFIDANALKYIVKYLSKGKDSQVWTSHVFIEREGNIYARFWEAITFISWRRYFGHPRDFSFGIKDFDYYPKGTTCFFCPRKVILEANDWFVNNTRNDKLSNDDTLLIRHIAETHNINISPKFLSTYHARTKLKQYTKHVYHRGSFFVDGFLRRDGNRFFWPLITFLVLSISVPICLIIFPKIILPFVVLLVIAWLLELIISLALGVPRKDSFSFFLLSPYFVVIYGLGIWTAVLDLLFRTIQNSTMSRLPNTDKPNNQGVNSKTNY